MTVYDWIISDDVGICDKPYYLIKLAGNSQKHATLVFQKLTTEVKYFKNLYENSIFLLARMYKGVLECFNQTGLVEDFCQNHDLNTAKQGISQGFETVKLYENIYAKNCEKFEQFQF